MIYFLVPATFALMQIPLDVNVDGKITLKEGAEEVEGEGICGKRKNYVSLTGTRQESCENIGAGTCYWDAKAPKPKGKLKLSKIKCFQKKAESANCKVDEECLSALCVKENAGVSEGICDGKSFDHRAVTEWIHETSAKKLIENLEKKKAEDEEKYGCSGIRHHVGELPPVNVSSLWNDNKKIAIFSFKMDPKPKKPKVEAEQVDTKSLVQDWVRKQIDSGKFGGYEITMTGEGQGAILAREALQAVEGEGKNLSGKYLIMYNLPKKAADPDLPKKAADPDENGTTRREYELESTFNKFGKAFAKSLPIPGSPVFIPLAYRQARKAWKKNGTQKTKVSNFFSCV